MTRDERKHMAERLEEKLVDMLREEGVLLDGYQLRELETIAKKLAFEAVMKKTELQETR